MNLTSCRDSDYSLCLSAQPYNMICKCLKLSARYTNMIILFFILYVGNPKRSEFGPTSMTTILWSIGK